jgi:hypothetical protein
MVAEVFAGISALKTAFDIAKGLKDIDDATRRNAAVIELQEKILSAQSAQAELVQSVSALEAEVARLKDWEADKARYQLAELIPGVVALAIKDSMRNGEPFHRICANCASNGKKSYLQQHVRGTSVDTYKCNSCGEGLTVDKGRSYPMPYAGGMDGSRNESGW